MYGGGQLPGLFPLEINGDQQQTSSFLYSQRSKDCARKSSIWKRLCRFKASRTRDRAPMRQISGIYNYISLRDITWHDDDLCTLFFLTKLCHFAPPKGGRAKWQSFVRKLSFLSFLSILLFGHLPQWPRSARSCRPWNKKNAWSRLTKSRSEGTSWIRCKACQDLRKT